MASLDVIKLVGLLLVISIRAQECPVNHFKLKGMLKCHPLLSCEDVRNITIVKNLGRGAVKNVYLVDWKGFFIVLSASANSSYIEDFLSGVKVLKLLSPNDYVVQFLGFCEETNVMLTEYHAVGNAADLFNSKSLSLTQALGFCLQYSLILNHLHNGPAGRRVFCDSNSLFKLLSQLLVTDRNKLVLNDVDALPEVVNGFGIKCGRRQIEGTFVAPEQLWTSSDKFSDELMPSYNEKTDIWKAATVCDFFLKKSHDGEVVRYKLFRLHSKCRSIDPSLRPTAEDLVYEYISVIKEFGSHSEL